MWAALRSGAWITRQRMVVYSVILLAVTVGSLIALAAGREGLNDARGRPLGTDFSNVYSAGTYARENHAVAAYDPVQQFAREKEIFGEDAKFFGWHYPPFFLLIAAALAALPYLWALAVWQLATFALYLRAQWLVLPDKLALLTAAAFPAVLVNVTHGHNGFLSAALLGAGLLWLPTRPLLAGLLLGLLAYKPQFGMLIPLALVAGMQWRATVSAAFAVGVMAIAATALWGAQVWLAFVQSLTFTREVVLEQGGTGFHKIPTMFAWVRMWGGSIDLAYMLHGLLQLLCAAFVWAAWRSQQSHEMKAAGLVIACVLFTPYMLDYDLMVMAPALAFWVRAGLRDGFRPYEKSALAFTWIMPLVARMAAQHAAVPLGQLSVLLLFGLLVTRLRAA